MTGMLASVADLAEALCVLEAGADIIDLKNPAAGALGALPAAQVAQIAAAVGGRRPVSATVGDLPMEPAAVRAAAAAMAATGVDYVKVGFFAGGDWEGTLAALAGEAARGVKLVAVLFADQGPDPAWAGRLAGAGFAGAMLDTCDKSAGPLTGVCGLATLREFVAEARRHGLLCGLAGSLRPADIPALRALRPDYLGFRGALCRGGGRTAGLDPAAVRAVRACLGAGAGPL